MKRIYFLLVFLLVLGSGGYVYYSYLNKTEVLSPWQVMPHHALWVIESKDLVKDWNTLTESDFWNNLKQVPALQGTDKLIKSADSLSGKDGSLHQLLANKSFLISGHVISTTHTDYLLVGEMGGVLSQKKWKQFIEQAISSQGLNHSTRQYQGEDIHEIKQADKKTFTYLIYNNLLVGSYTPFLVEDVIRQIKSSQSLNFFGKEGQIPQSLSAETSFGKIYLNLAKLKDWFKTYGEEAQLNAPIFERFASISSLELRLENQLALLNGFTQVAPSDSSAYLTIFKDQKAGAILMKHLIPNRTAWVQHMSFSDAALLEKSLKKYHQTLDPNYQKTQQKIDQDFQVKHSDFFKILDGEVALANLETLSGRSPEKVLYLRCNDINEALNKFTVLAEKVSLSQKDTLLSEFYGNSTITLLNQPDIPYYLFGKGFEGFPQSYFALQGKYLIVANSIETIKNVLSDVEAENTWGRSVKQSLYMENNVAEANVSLMLNTQRFWSSVMQFANEDKKEYLRQLAPVFKSIGYVSFQLSDLDNQFYTSLALNYQPVEQIPTGGTPYQQVFAGKVDAKIITKPYVVRNHLDNSFEVFLQDSLFNIYLIDKKGQILWKDSLGVPIVSDVQQVDFYANGKLQIAFASPQAIHIIDRNGDKVDNFPLKLTYTVAHFSIIDYDNSKKYRFVAIDESGKAYMYDKKQENLEGWNPRNLDGKANTPIRHVRARGRDFLYVGLESGKIALFNRRGEMAKGFPIDLKDRLDNPLFVEVNNSLENTKITTISDRGQWLTINMLGQTLRSEQLYKPTKDTHFQLVTGAMEKDYVIIRQEANRVSLLNNNSEELFDKDYLSTEIMSGQYYSFGSGKTILVVNDPEQDFSYLYDQEGNLVNFQPLESQQPISLLYSEVKNTYQVYSCYENGYYLQEFVLGD
ncbi:hypothetical protein QWY31_00300 [Cytophagales bacterium LB-30]|uniref:DUF3352 domain-containing protein n=1 Tax=Shiella aurantiaca TaxID=3058365 RepID=A0ABT8F0G1_9BACT|nr:DUF3352 domain-containing protein [Shiella aurantiaca]MDN4163915.1 hypothetical protein [Shiella aurantiaca]